MDLILPYKPNPLLCSSTPLTHLTPKTLLFKLPTKQRPKISRKNSNFRVKAAANPNGPDGFSWVSLARSIRRGSEQFWSNFGDSVKKETGFDLNEVNVKVGEYLGQAGEGLKRGGTELERFRTELVPEFVSWNQWERWKDIKTWEPKRVAALVFYVFIAVVSCQRMYVAIRAPIQDRRRKELTEAYMEAVIPEPSPSNVRKLKKSIWRKTTPKGLKMKKFVEGPDGTLVHDSSYVGEDAWDDDPQLPQDNVKQFIDSDIKLNPEEKKELKEDLGVSGEVQEDTGTWRERLQKWKEILQKEKLAEQLDSANSKYVVEFDMKEVENSLRKDVVEKVTETQGTRALWIAKRWWLYRPKLPYTYFLQKLDSSEVAAVVFTEDLKRIYVTMKEGFPLEYVASFLNFLTDLILMSDSWMLNVSLYMYIEETEELATEELAMNGLRNNRHILDMITEELLEKSRITGLEVIEKMKDLSPVMFEDFVTPYQINLEEDGPLPHNDQLRYQPLDIYPAPLHRC